MFLERLKQFIAAKKLFNSDDKILLAVSGGKDSVLMAHLFNRLNYNFGIIHCNFGLRLSESDRDEAFVRQLAQHFNVPFFVKKFDTQIYANENKLSIQMAARELRYSFFEETRLANNYAKLAVAHHQNDAIETVILNLVRGTGIAGLHGILADRNHIIRPFLCFSQHEIEEIVADLKVEYVEDSSNQSTKYMRNFIRHKIIPELKTLNSNLEETFQKNISYFSDLEIFTQQKLDELKQRIFVKTDEGYKMLIADIEKLHPQQFLLFELLKPFSFNSSTIKSIINAVEHQSGKAFFTLTHQLLIDRQYIYIRKNNTQKQNQVLWDAHSSSIDFDDYTFCVKEINNVSNFKTPPFELLVNSNQLIFPLTIRHWEIGDKFIPFGMKKFKKLSDFFVSEKLSVYDKQKVPLLVNRNGDIIWVCGLRSDNRYKINMQTEKISIFEMQSRKNND